MTTQSFKSPYNETYIKDNIHATDIKVQFTGKITGELDKYNYDENGNPKSGVEKSRFNNIYNTGYFYLNKDILKEYNLLYGLKLPLPQFFLDEKLLRAVILDIPEIRSRLLYKSSNTYKIKKEEGLEFRLFHLVNRGVTDKTADDAAADDAAADDAADAIDNKNFKTRRDIIFNQNLKVIYDLFFLPGNYFFIDGFKFIIGTGGTTNSSSLLIEKKDLPPDLKEVKETGLINAYIVSRLAPFLKLPPSSSTPQQVFEYHLKNVKAELRRENPTRTPASVDAEAVEVARAAKRTFEADFQDRLQHIQHHPHYYADAIEKYAKELIVKFKERARKQKINVDFKYRNRSIKLISFGRTYYKNIVLKIDIYPYNERFSFPLKTYCVNQKNKLIGNTGAITKKLRSYFRHKPEILKKLKITLDESEPLEDPTGKDKIYYKQYIRKQRLKGKKRGGNGKIKKIRKTTKLGKIYKRTSKRYRRKFKPLA